VRVDENLAELLGQRYGGRRWIIAMDVLVAATPLVEDLRRLGAGELYVIAGSRGTGPVPDDVASVVLGTGGAGIMDGIRRFQQALGDLPPAVTAAVEAFDPDGAAKVIGSPFAEHAEVAGRGVHGARPQRWQVLEDKTTVDALWDAAGVARAPSLVVPAEPTALRTASERLDDGSGVVWVADNRAGWHGGATGLRWVTSPDQAEQAAAFIAQRADQVRVMPFLDGIPCSIHGMVFDDLTAVFRPCEMVVLRRPGRSDLFYAGMATTWDPEPAGRDEMRSAARRVGDHLRATVGYRGIFTIDGVMTVGGFLPTELNPRFGAAVNLLAAAADLPLYLLHLAVIAEPGAPWSPRRLERMIVTAADADRGVRGVITVARTLAEQEVGLRLDGHDVVVAGSQPADVTLATGPAAMGAALRLTVDTARRPSGSSIAPVTAAVLSWADRQWDLGLGPLEPAPDVTR
jgi:hypothetical protein